MDLLLSGRVLFAEEALALGLVNRVVPAEDLLEATVAYARDIAANCSPIALASMKAQVYAAAESSLEAARLQALGLWADRHKGHPEAAARLRGFRPAVTEGARSWSRGLLLAAGSTARSDIV